MTEKNKTKVSIIMPVYNGEAFLKTALDSVVNQTFKDFELICINDGSTDNSLKILEEYAKNDNRIKIYSQKNQGQGAAKNYALTLFNGEYVMFLDQDDYLEPNACEVAYEYVNRYDVELVIFSATTFTEFEKNEVIEQHIQAYRYFPDLAYNVFNLCDLGETIRFINIPPWSKIYKKSLFETGRLKYTENAIIEDIAFLMNLISLNPKVVIIKEILYNYNFPRAGQISSEKGLNVLSIFKSFEYFEGILSILDNYTYARKGLLTLKFQHLIYWYARTKWYVKLPYLFKLRNEFIKLYREGWTDNDFSQILDINVVHAFLSMNFVKLGKLIKKR